MNVLLEQVQRHAIGVLALAALATAGCLYYAQQRLQISTDTASMISAELPFRQAWERYKHEFPLSVDSLLIVIDAGSPEAADAAAGRLTEALARRQDLFVDVHAPGLDEFFRRNAFLYLDEDELASLADRLLEVQPLLGRLSQDPSLARFADTLTLALEEDELELGKELPRVLAEFEQAVAASLAGHDAPLSWQRLLAPPDGDGPDTRRFVLLKPRLDFSDLLAAEPAMQAIRETAAALQLDAAHGVRLRITGDAALAYEELLSAMRGAQLAGTLALFAISIVLLVGLGSAWLALASLLTLLCGLVMTAAFATLAVGHLNLISIAFAVLYIGLGVDYSIHICLRYRELLGRGLPQAEALREAVASVARSLAICSLTTATAFYAFLPTAFAGVAELGLISGTGMFINLGLNLVLLPALLQRLPVPPAWQQPPSGGRAAALLELPRRHRAAVLGTTALAAAAAAWLLPQLEFDRNTLNLRDPQSESVATVRELMANSDDPLMSIEILADDDHAWTQRRARLEELPEVRETRSLDDFVPDADEDKLFIVDELALALGPDLGEPPPPKDPPPGEGLAKLQRLAAALEARAARGDALGPAAARAAARLAELLQQASETKPEAQAALLRRLEHNLLGWLPQSLRQLSLAMEPALDPAQLPDSLRRRWIGRSGTRRINVQPGVDVESNAGLRAFVDAVQAVVPDATGEPVIALRAGDAVVQAFQQAFSSAVVVITLLLLVLMRSLVATLLVLSPLLLAALLSLGLMVLLGAPLNFANVIALPLLFGIGVDNGIHMVQRARFTHSPEDNPLRTSTARAILFSSLTTILSFGNLLLSPHPGTASMGLLLSIGMSVTLLTTLLVLPALLAAWPAARTRA
ncbi:MAG: hopanoid biosynthesis-associated RND transporter HpnN [Gammaproteobacteria bacterium]|nr:MAG: hopanoid biosynthesis-associated RND transporter HpnN [Gammaproteobacteria bacterium]